MQVTLLPIRQDNGQACPQINDLAARVVVDYNSCKMAKGPYRPKQICHWMKLGSWKRLAVLSFKKVMEFQFEVLLCQLDHIHKVPFVDTVNTDGHYEKISPIWNLVGGSAD